MTLALIPVTEIKFLDKEGPIEESEKVHKEQPTFSTWADANSQLYQWAATAPKGGAYHKVWYVITWANGDVHRGRIDLHHILEPQETPSGRLDLGESVKSQIGVYVKYAEPATKGKLRKMLEVLSFEDGKSIAEQSIAEQISARFDDDGAKWISSEGVHIQNVCYMKSVSHSEDPETTRYHFRDGSGIVVTPAGWDVSIPGSSDECCCQVYHHEDCPDFVEEKAT